MTKFFLKITNGFDLEPRTLKVEPARDVVIPNICAKLHYNPSINVGASAMTKFFFLKIATVTLTLSPGP